MKKLLTTLAAVAVVAVAANADAQIFETAQNTLSTTFRNVRTIIYVLGGFGLIGLAAAALLGKVNWKWLFALITGLAIVAAAGAIVDYATSGANEEAGEFDSGLMGDTLG